MTDRQPGAARQRVLDVARDLFAENGYAGTSIADIAERLEVSKAAVYYHFQAKADLLRELIAPAMRELHDLAEEPDAQPRQLLERLVDVLVTQLPMIMLLAGDPSAMHELKAMAPTETFGRMRRALAGPHASATRLLRARCAMGAVHAGIVGPVIEHMRADDAAAMQPVKPMTTRERRVVIDAALAALGEPAEPTG